MSAQVVTLPAGDAPGLQWRTRTNGDRIAVWVAPRKAVETGYAPKTARLTGSPIEIAAVCRRLQAEALEWIAGKRGTGIVPIFDGSMSSLIRIYQTEPLSGFSKVKYNTRDTYTKQFALLDRTVGTRMLHALNARDFDRWYTEFRQPACEGGPERISRAHYLMTLVRMLMKFGIRMEYAECARLAGILATMDFENSRPRTALLTYDMVKAFCAEARKSGRLSLALATSIQFECALRQRDVIGEWQQITGEFKRHGAEGKQWTTGLRWGENVSLDLIMTKATSKSRGRETVEVDWKGCPLIMEQLQYVPPESRIGPVIVSEVTRRPYFIDAFCVNWRAVARRAGIPDNVWNMDARSGAITEGSEAGIALDRLGEFATHKSLKMTGRYNRMTRTKTDQVISRRVAHREGRGVEK